MSLLNNLLNQAAFVNQKGGTHGAHIRFAVIFLFLPHAVSLHDGLVGIDEQREGQVVFESELLMGRHAVDAHADDLNITSFQLFLVVAQVAGLGGATRRVVFGIKVKGDFPTSVVMQADGVAILVLGGEVGGGLAGFGKHMKC